MGKASRWFRSVLGLKKSDQPFPSSSQSTTTPARPKDKRRWSFVKSYRDKDHHCRDCSASSSSFINAVPEKNQDDDEEQRENPNQRAIAVAAATAAVAEAAVAAAHAAAEVVRMTSSGRSAGNGSVFGSSSSAAYVSGSLGLREDFAALKIQAAFRGYLARRALKALKAVVRLQALVRGHIERKRTEAWLQQMQAVLLAQARARVGRIQASESSHSSGGKSSHSHYNQHHQYHNPGPATPEKVEHGIRATKSGKYEPSSLLKRTGSRSNDNKAHSSLRKSDTWDQQQQGPWTSTKATMEDEKNSDKILEIDNGGGGRHQFGHKRRNMFHSANLGFFSDQYSHSFTTSKDTAPTPSPSSGEVQSMYPLEFSHEVDQELYCTAENSPQLYSASSSKGGKRSPFTPTRSDGSRSFLSGFSDHPNYMSYTESARAKARSLSAPKQRPHYERSIPAKRFSVNGYGEPRSSSAQRASAVRASFSSKAYPGSGRLDSLGMPMWQKC
ncbi:Protein IQ-DOMAIN 22 [Linum perenne]